MDLTNDILNNREKYPDTAEITLTDGTKVSIKEFREQLQPRAEFTRASEGWRRKESQLNDAVTGLQGQLTQLTADLAAATAERGRPAAPAGTPEGPTDEELDADPVLRRLHRRTIDTQKQLTDALAKVEAHETRLANHESTWIQRDYVDQLGRIGTYHNGRFNKDGKGKAFDQAAFIDFVTTRSKVNPAFATDLGLAYNEYSRTDEMALVAREAEERGREAGKREARIPPIPNGRRNTPVRPEGLPASLQELSDEQVLNDPDIQTALRGDETA